MDVLARARPRRSRCGAPARRDEIVGAALYLASDASIVHDRDDPHGRRRRAVEHAGQAGEARPCSPSQPKRAEHRPLWLRPCTGSSGRSASRSRPLLHSDTYFDLVTEAHRARARHRAQALEGVSRRLLHLLNLPAGSDIRRVREQLARVERRLAALSKDSTSASARPRRAPERRRDGTAPQPVRPARRASTATSSARCCARATASATSAGRTAPQRRRDAQGRRLAARQGAAVALPRRPRPLRPAAADRAQPRQPQLHPRPAARQQRRRVPRRTPGFDVFMLDWGVPDELDADNSFATYVDEYLPRAVEAVRRRDRLRRGDAGRLLPRRRARAALRRRARRRRACATSS